MSGQRAPCRKKRKFGSSPLGVESRAAEQFKGSILSQLEEWEDSRIRSSLPQYLTSVFAECHDNTQRTNCHSSRVLPMSESLADQGETLFSPILFDSPEVMPHNSTPVEHPDHLCSCATTTNCAAAGCTHTLSMAMTTIFSTTCHAGLRDQPGSHLQPGLSVPTSTHQTVPVGLTSIDPLLSLNSDVEVRSTITNTTGIQLAATLSSTLSLQTATTSGPCPHSTKTAHISNVTVSHQIYPTTTTTFAGTALKNYAEKRHSMKSRKRLKFVESDTSTSSSSPIGCSLLRCCSTSEVGSIVSFMAIVLQVNPPCEVALQKSSLARHTVAMASLVVADPSLSHFKITLWQEAAEWAEKIKTGDIVLFYKMCMKQWRGEKLAHTTMASHVLNLHQTESLPDRLKHRVSENCLQQFFRWARKKHFYLFCKLTPNPECRTMAFTPSSQLVPEAIINFRGKLMQIIASRAALFGDDPLSEVILYFGSEHWINKLENGVGVVWEVTNLFVLPEGTQAGCCCLRTTTHTSMRPVDKDSAVAMEILLKFSGSVTRVFDDIMGFAELVSSKKSGRFQCKARAVSMKFLLSNGELLDLLCHHGDTPVAMLSQVSLATYIGCSQCQRSLTQDSNGVYCLCRFCMATCPGVILTSVFCFRPLTVCLEDVKSVQIEAMAPPTSISQLLLGKDDLATKVNRVLCEIGSQATCEKLAMSLKSRLLSLQNDLCLWRISFSVVCDENSFIESTSCIIIQCTHP